MKLLIGLLVAFGIGFGCGSLGIPVPAPPVINGALLVLAMTLGYVGADRFFARREAKARTLCGGPTGHPESRREAAEPRESL